MYVLRWKNALIDANKSTPIEVPVGSVVSNKASIRFTGKGAANYGSIQQENQMRLLENFADTVAPLYPTVGQEWFDTTTGVLKVCAAVTDSSIVWRSLGGVQATNQDSGPPSPASIGDLWSEAQSSSNTDNPFPSATGTMYVYNGFGRHPQSSSNEIGGWNQVWPQIETIAGREEYDLVAGLVNQLAGPIDGGGNGMIGKWYAGDATHSGSGGAPALPNLAQLDNSLRNKFTSASAKDISVLTPVDAPTDELMVDVTSQDWDTLLAVARKAVSRLELPPEMVNDISPVPFVSDGRPVPTWMRRLDPADIMYPSLERRSNRRFGIVTLSRAFTETVNVLNNAVANRYSLKGISGATGPNSSYSAETLVVPQRTFNGNAVGNQSGFLTLRFNFSTEAEYKSFLNSGGALQLVATHTINPSTQTSGDVDFKALLDNYGVIRITADKTRVLSNAAQPAMTAQPSTVGLQDTLTDAKIGIPVVLTTQVLGIANYKITVNRVTATQLNVTLEFASSDVMNGNINLAWSVIRDSSVYQNGGVSTAVFGSPLGYVDSDKLASSSFLN